MNKDTFSCLHGFLNEVKYSIGCFVFIVKYDLIVLIKPEEGKISNSNWFPVIRDLLTGTVYDMCHFVGNNEFYIL